jgi:hypothetical protein
VDAATTFLGRILVEYHTIDEKHPEMKLKDINITDAGFMSRLAKM